MDTLVYENYIVCNILQGALFLRLESQWNYTCVYGSDGGAKVAL